MLGSWGPEQNTVGSWGPDKKQMGSWGPEKSRLGSWGPGTPAGPQDPKEKCVWLEQKISGVIGEGEGGPLKHESGVPMVVVRFGTAVFGTTKIRCPVGGPGVPDPARPWQTDCYYFFL